MTPGTETASRERRQQLLLFVVAFLLRLTFLFVYGFDSDPLADVDDEHYHQIASDLTLRGDYENRWFPPGYPLFIASIYRVCGLEPAAVRVSQALLSALTCWIAFLLGSQLFGRRVGLVAGWLLALYPAHIYLAWRLLAETPYALLITLSVFLAGRFQASPTSRGGAILGLTLGMSNLFKSNLVIYPPALFVWLTTAIWHRRPRTMAPFASCLLLFLLSFGLGPLANLAASKGRTSLLASNAGHTLWWSNNPSANGYFVSPKDSEEAQEFIMRQGADQELERIQDLPFDERAAAEDPIYRRLAITWITENPVRFLTLTGKKLQNAFGVSPTARVFRSGSWAGRVHLLSYGLLIPFFIAGAVLSLRRWRDCVPLYLVLACYTVMVMLFYGTPRFTIIVTPCLMVLAALALEKSIGWLSARLRADL